jgi:uncharacterized protein
MTSLLDVNVLVALHWPGHQFHREAHDWFARRAAEGWATCPFTQAAFVRIVSNPAFSPKAVSPEEAIRALTTSLEHPAHRFWSDDVTFAEAVRSFEGRLIGHKQVTDAYLLGLTLHKRGKLVTLDRSLAGLAAGDRQTLRHIEIIQG